LKVILGTVNAVVVCISKMQHRPPVRIRVRRSDVICEQLFLFLLSHSTGRNVMRCWARPVSDS